MTVGVGASGETVGASKVGAVEAVGGIAVRVVTIWTLGAEDGEEPSTSPSKSTTGIVVEGARESIRTALGA